MNVAKKSAGPTLRHMSVWSCHEKRNSVAQKGLWNSGHVAGYFACHSPSSSPHSIRKMSLPPKKKEKKKKESTRSDGGVVTASKQPTGVRQIPFKSTPFCLSTHGHAARKYPSPLCQISSSITMFRLSRHSRRDLWGWTCLVPASSHSRPSPLGQPSPGTGWCPDAT